MPGIVTATTPTTSAALTTLEAAYEALDAVPGSADATLARLIARASAAIVAHCGRDFGRESVTEVFRLAAEGAPPNTGRAPLVLARTPVVAITAVSVNGVALDPAGWECDMAAGLLYRLAGAGRAPWAARPVSVDYVAGYMLPGEPSPTLPADVEDVCLSLVCAAWHARGRDTSVRSEQVENTSRVEWFDRGAGGMQIGEELAERLAPYVARVA